MNYYQLSHEYILRADAHFGNYIIFNYQSAKTVQITDTDHILLSKMADCPCSIEDLTDHLNHCRPDISASIENVSEVLNFYLDKGFVKILNSGIPQSQHLKAQKTKMPVPLPAKTPVLSFPIEVDIFLTKRCNMRCSHCSVDAGLSNTEELSVQYWKNIFDQLEANKVLKIVISGGEPLLYSGFWELLDHIKNKKFYKCLLTNGSTMTEDAIKKLKRAGISLGISLDGSSSEVHDTFRKKEGAFEKVMVAMERCGRHGVPFDILSTVHRRNIGQIESLFQIANSFNAIGIFFYMIENVGRGKNAINYRLSAEERKIVREQFLKLRERFPHIPSTYTDPEIHIQEHDEKNSPSCHASTISCRAGNAYMAVDNDGIVYPCPFGVFLRKLPVGDSKKDSLSDIWQKGNWSIFREGLTIEQLPACAKCAKQDHCKLKECRMRSLANGDLYTPPFNCPQKAA